MITQRIEVSCIYVGLLRFIFLDANDIGRVIFKPVEETFLHSSPDSIDIITDNLHETKVGKASNEEIQKTASLL
jgi:hypothetical protein